MTADEFERTRRLKWPSLAVIGTLLTASVAIATVILHAVGAVAHMKYLRFWGVDADVFPKSTEWTLINGYYATFDRLLTALLGVTGEVLIFLLAAIAAGLYVGLLFDEGSSQHGRLGIWMTKLPERTQAFVRRSFRTFLLVLLLPIVATVLALFMAIPAALGETAALAAAQRRAEDFRKGCDASKIQCIELRRASVCLARGYLLDSSATHIAIFDIALHRARVIPRSDLEVVAGREIQ